MSQFQPLVLKSGRVAQLDGDDLLVNTLRPVSGDTLTIGDPFTIVEIDGSSVTVGDGRAALVVGGDASFGGALNVRTLPAMGGILKYQLVYGYNDSGVNKAALALADDPSTAPVFGVATINASSGDPCTITTVGVYPVQLDAAPSAADVGAPVYLSATTAGIATLTPPVTTGQVVVRVGFLNYADGATDVCNVALHLGDPCIL